MPASELEGRRWARHGSPGFQSSVLLFWLQQWAESLCWSSSLRTAPSSQPFHLLCMLQVQNRRLCMDTKIQVHPHCHTASHGSYMQHTTPKRKCKELILNTVSQTKKKSGCRYSEKGLFYIHLPHALSAWRGLIQPFEDAVLDRTSGKAVKITCKKVDVVSWSSFPQLGSSYSNILFCLGDARDDLHKVQFNCQKKGKINTKKADRMPNPLWILTFSQSKENETGILLVTHGLCIHTHTLNVLRKPTVLT